MKAINSVTSTILSKIGSETGTPRGELGSLMHSNSDRVAAWLQAQRPSDMDKAAVSRASSHNVALTVRYEGRYPTAANGERLPSYQVAVACDAHGSDDDRRRALADLVNFTTPAPHRVIEEWIAELSVISASRGKDEMELGLMLNAYVSRLSLYPADVVRDALLVKPWKWFPTWDELRSYCEAKAGPRRHMIAALQAPAPDPEPSYRAPTQAERDRVQALVDEMFPRASEFDRTRAVNEALKGDCMKDAAQ